MNNALLYISDAELTRIRYIATCHTCVCVLFTNKYIYMYLHLIYMYVDIYQRTAV